MSQLTKVFESPSAFFGYFDLLVWIPVVVYYLFIFRTKRYSLFNYFVTISVGTLFTVGPFISCKIEWIIQRQLHGDIDSINMLYIIFRYPIWWAFGLLTLVVNLELSMRKRTVNHEKENLTQ